MATVGANDNGLGLKAGGRHGHMAYMASPITAGLSEIGKSAKKFKVGNCRTICIQIQKQLNHLLYLKTFITVSVLIETI